MKMNNQERYSFSSFIDLVKSEPLTVFAGAGISFYSGVPLVLGDDGIIPTIIRFLPSRKKDFNLIVNSNIQFELFFESIISTGDYKILFSIFNSDFPTFGHRLFSELCKLGVINSIVTTNFDLLFEKALNDEYIDYKLYTDESLERINWQDKLPLIKLHGSLENDELGITLDTITSENHLSRCNVAINEIFNSSKSPKNIIFFGYSFSDYFDISPSIIRNISDAKRVFIINHKHENTGNIVFKQLDKFKDKFIFDNPKQNIFNVDYNGNLFIEKLYNQLGLSKYHFISHKSSKHISIIKKWSKSLSLSEAHLILADILYDIKRIKEALFHYKKSLDLCLDDELKLKAHILNNIVISYRYIGKYFKALKYLEKGDKVAKTLGDMNVIGRNLGIRATINKNMGNRKEAYKYHILEEKIKLKSGNNYGLSFCYNNLALLLIDGENPTQKNITKAIRYLDKAEILKKEAGDINGLAFTIRHRAAICVLEGKFEEALEVYSQEEKLRKRLTNYAELADCKGNQAIVYGKMGDYDKAIILFKKEIDICLKYNFTPTLIDSYVKQIKFYITYKQNKKAKKLIEDAYILAKKINHSSIEELDYLRLKLNSV